MLGSRNFRQGEGGPGPNDRKSSDNLFIYSPQLISQSGSYGYFKKNYNSARFQGGPTFFKGSQLFPGEGGLIAYSYRKL